MKQYKKETQTKEVDVLEKTICDKCQKDITLSMGDGDFATEGVELVIDAGYGSRFDTFAGPSFKFDLCDDCCAEIIAVCGHKE